MSSGSIPSEYRSELSNELFETEEKLDFYEKDHILDSNQKGTNDTDKNSKTDSDPPLRK